MRTVAYLLALVVLLVLVALFSVLNPGRISVDLAFAAVEMEKSVVLIGVLTIGWLFGLLCAMVAVLRLMHQRRQLRRALHLAEQEVQALRSMPVRDAD